MSINKPRTQFGFSQMTAVSATDGLPLGTVKVLANYTANSEREAVDLYGGSNPNAWDSESGKVTSDLSLTVKEFKPFLYELAGYTVTTNAAEPDGAIASPLTNVKGSTVVTSSGATAAVLTTGAAADLKDSVYVVKAVSPTTVDVYAVNDINFKRGTDITYATDLLKITTGALTLTTGAGGVAIPGIGVSLTSTGAIPSMTTDDTAVFEVRSANEASYSYSLGENPTPQEFGMYLVSQKKANGEFRYEYYPRVKFSSVPSGMDMGAWKEDITLPMKVLYDVAKGYSKKIYDLVTDLS